MLMSCSGNCLHTRISIDSCSSCRFDCSLHRWATPATLCLHQFLGHVTKQKLILVLVHVGWWYGWTTDKCRLYTLRAPKDWLRFVSTINMMVMTAFATSLYTLTTDSARTKTFVRKESYILGCDLCIDKLAEGRLVVLLCQDSWRSSCIRRCLLGWPWFFAMVLLLPIARDGTCWTLFLLYGLHESRVSLGMITWLLLKLLMVDASLVL